MCTTISPAISLIVARSYEGDATRARFEKDGGAPLCLPQPGGDLGYHALQCCPVRTATFRADSRMGSLGDGLCSHGAGSGASCDPSMNDGSSSGVFRAAWRRGVSAWTLIQPGGSMNFTVSALSSRSAIATPVNSNNVISLWSLSTGSFYSITLSPACISASAAAAGGAGTGAGMSERSLGSARGVEAVELGGRTESFFRLNMMVDQDFSFCLWLQQAEPVATPDFAQRIQLSACALPGGR